MNFYLLDKNLLSAYYVPGPRDTKPEFKAIREGNNLINNYNTEW